MRVDGLLGPEPLERMEPFPGLYEALRTVEALFPVQLERDVLQEVGGDLLDDEEHITDGEAVPGLAVDLIARGAALAAFEGGLGHLLIERDVYDRVPHLPGGMAGASAVRITTARVLPLAAGLGDAAAHDVPGHRAAPSSSSRAVLNSFTEKRRHGLQVTHCSTSS